MGKASFDGERFYTCSEIGCGEVITHFIWFITYLQGTLDTELPVLIPAPTLHITVVKNGAN